MMPSGLGETLMLETAHPEAVTMPRKWPEAQRIRVIGGLDPAPFNGLGLGRGVGLAVHEGRMTIKEASTSSRRCSTSASASQRATRPR